MKNWKKGLVLGVMLVVLLACEVSVSEPTEVVDALQTSIAQTVQAQNVDDQTGGDQTGDDQQVEPTDTLPPPTMTPTDEPEPVPPTDTPEPPPPTDTPEPCAIPIAPEFEAALTAEPAALAALGCPTESPIETWAGGSPGAAEQIFEFGRMIWQRDTDMIHIMFEGGSYLLVPDQTAEGAEEDDYCPAIGPAPAGFVKPIRGFGWHWCNTTNVQAGLGWAVADEAGYDAVWQPFENGHVMQGRTGGVLVFFDDDMYQIIE